MPPLRRYEMKCQCCGTIDHRNQQGPVTVFTVEGLCTVCRAWFVGIGIESNVSYKHWALAPLKLTRASAHNQGPGGTQ